MNLKSEKRFVKIESHGTAYFIENNFLACCPLLVGGKLCKESSCIVEEAPKSFRRDHLKALRLLGIGNNEAVQYLKNINYYEE